ncbi:MAG TPA: class I SAM-dependent methyltransferase [Candidatus Dormibacteraeota bacterium]
MIRAYGLRVGVDLLRTGAVRQSLPFLIQPVNYWRHLEYGILCEALAPAAGDAILDVGSPKLLSAYLVEQAGATVWATDIEPYFLATYRAVRRVRRLPPGRLRLAVADGRRLPFATGAFDKAYALSVLEHIPGEGDSECVAEVGRVLRAGGRFAATVPFWPTSRSESKSGFYWSQSSVESQPGQTFYQRRYSEADIHRRLVEPSGLRLRRLAYVGERVLVHSEHEVADYLNPLLGPVQPELSRLLHTAPTDDWRTLKKPLCALVVLEKPRAEDATCDPAS